MKYVQIVAALIVALVIAVMVGSAEGASKKTDKKSSSSSSKKTDKKSDKAKTEPKPEPEKPEPIPPAEVKSSEGIRFRRAAGLIPRLPELKGNFEDKDTYQFFMGTNEVHAHCRYYLTEFFGKKLLWAGADVRNETTNTVHIAYYVAFYDGQSNLVACSGQNSSRDGIAPDAKSQLGSCLIALPEDLLLSIKRFEAVLAHDTLPIGTP